ncbi:MAG: M23 family metallopeptidase [Eubacteriales bacterium]|nr:M23 family metallopeptidase [Bacillota bacterium]MBV1726996.1 M23 family metallopeptidase [Desulforudis sp.]MDP3051711.1 M23 family metallopeptidase [Eubacteriales bacterium]MDQ7789835.1 M23 family metallopeptidase [Clostridia bacterium]MBU4534040.1 M23 family metallopeptidase [Bacillota bacterium]
MKRFSQSKWDWPSKPQPPRRGPSRRLIGQCLLVLAVFLVLLAIKDSRGPLGTQVRDTLAYVLTTEWNYQTAVDRVVHLGLQTVAVDLPFLTGPPHRDTAEVLGPVNEKGDFSDEELPLPVSGRVVKEFGWVVDPLDNLERFSPGIGIEAAEGSPIRAVMPGTVKMVGTDRTYGKYVLVDHGEEVYTLYANLGGLLVENGDRVSVGQVLGAAGTEGSLAEPGLHFELREQGRLIDPLTRLAPPTR